jgi:putative ABC transport system substrate-binding protein
MADGRRRVLVLGALAALAPRARAAAPMRRVGLLLLTPSASVTDPFIAGLRGRGWHEGRDIALATRFTASAQDQAVKLARELLEWGAEVVVAVSTANAVAARKATQRVPIVMLGGGYPVESGLAKSLARPGGNVTGISIYAERRLFGKYVSLVKELVPHVRELGVLWGYTPPAFPQVESDITLGEMRKAAQSINVRLREWRNGSQQQLDSHLSDASSASIDALFVTSGAPQAAPGNVARIAELCRVRRLPAVCDVTGAFFHAAGVLAYTADLDEIGARATSMVDRILRGADPAELPMEQPTRFNLVVNMRQARTIATPVPAALLVRADRVIE